VYNLIADGFPGGISQQLTNLDTGGHFPLEKTTITPSVPRSSHGNKWLNAVNKMMVGLSGSLYRRWL
jgi:hypothetical protein